MEKEYYEEEKSKRKTNTITSLLIISFLFLISVIIIIAGYNFTMSFGAQQQQTLSSIEVFTMACKGITLIIIGVFLVLLVQILLFDLKFKALKQEFYKYRNDLFTIFGSIYETQQTTNRILESLVGTENTKEHEKIQKVISDRNENIQNLINNVDVFQNEVYTLQNKVNRLSKELQDLKNSKQK